jgi:FkbM family methyltransferase
MILDFNALIKKYNLKINGVLHIGAHHGQEYTEYIKNNIENAIFFEPVLETFNILQSNIKDPRVVLVNKALGSESKKISMNIEKNNGGMSSSVLSPKLHLEMYPHIKFTEKQEVDMITLDPYMKEVSDYKKFNFINIDVQGYELEVLKGSSETLLNIDYIMTEVNLQEMYENCVLINQLDLFLKKFKFTRKEMWNNNAWGDALYIKEYIG